MASASRDLVEPRRICSPAGGPEAAFPALLHIHPALRRGYHLLEFTGEYRNGDVGACGRQAPTRPPVKRPTRKPDPSPIHSGRPEARVGYPAGDRLRGANGLERGMNQKPDPSLNFAKDGAPKFNFRTAEKDAKAGPPAKDAKGRPPQRQSMSEPSRR